LPSKVVEVTKRESEEAGAIFERDPNADDLDFVVCAAENNNDDGNDGAIVSG